MAEFDIVNEVGYLIVNDDNDLLAWLQSRKCTEIMDRNPNLKIEIVYRDETH